MADVISGSAELIQSNSDVKSTDAAGLSTTIRSESLLQRYQLYYSNLIFPNVNFRIGSGFDKTATVTKEPETVRSTDTAIYPSVSLTLSNPFVFTGVGYNKRQETVDISNASSVTTIQETKNAFFGLRPEGLPSVNVQFSRVNDYDRAHLITDSQTDLLLGTMRYSIKNLDLSYSVTSNDVKDNLSGVEATTVTQNPRVGYTNQFFNNRIYISGDYNGFRSTTETKTGSGGVVLFQLFPFTGLSDISDIPTLEVLSTNQALIDGNLVASSGINIGKSVSQGGDTRLRNVGLDFVNATSVNTLYVYVDRQLPSTITNPLLNGLQWDVYISSDNQTWTPHLTGLQGTLNPFTNRFELTFPGVTTRYIKVSVRPVSVAYIQPAGFDVSTINITELQAYTSKPAAQAAGTTVLTSQLYDANLRAAITEDRSLLYTFYYSKATSNIGVSTSLLSNTLSYSKQFSPVYSGSARVGRDDNRNQLGSTVSYSGSVSLMAVPLPTLTNSLVVSGRRDETQGQVSTSESLFLYNATTLYQGVSFNLSGGLNNAVSFTGVKTRTTLLNAGLSVVPNKYFSLTVNHSESQPIQTSTQTTTGLNRSSSTIGSIAWTPAQTLYFAYSISQTVSTNTPHQTTQNYSTSWSPFSTGTLNLTFQYSETQQTLGTLGYVDRGFTTGVQWRVGPRIELTASYAVTSSKSPSLSSDATNISTDLRLSF